MTATHTATEDFVISRVFDAPRDVVWKAWTDAEALAKWLGPKGCTTNNSVHTSLNPRT